MPRSGDIGSDQHERLTSPPIGMATSSLPGKDPGGCCGRRRLRRPGVGACLPSARRQRHNDRRRPDSGRAARRRHGRQRRAAAFRPTSRQGHSGGVGPVGRSATQVVQSIAVGNPFQRPGREHGFEHVGSRPKVGRSRHRGDRSSGSRHLRGGRQPGHHPSREVPRPVLSSPAGHKLRWTRNLSPLRKEAPLIRQLSDISIYHISYNDCEPAPTAISAGGLPLNLWLLGSLGKFSEPATGRIGGGFLGTGAVVDPTSESRRRSEWKH